MICTNKDIVKCFETFLTEKWGYVYGSQGEMYTKDLAEKWKKQGRSVPSSSWDKATYFTDSCKKWFGHRVADCSGGIIAALRSFKPDYADRTADTFRSQAKIFGKISSIPEIQGVAVWRKGHIGIYVGNGEVIEFRGTNYGCVKTKLKDRDFTEWFYLADVEYITYANTCTPTLPVLRKGNKGVSVRNMQTMLVNAKMLDKADSIFGKGTEQAVKTIQHYYGLAEDGIVGKDTWKVIITMEG